MNEHEGHYKPLSKNHTLHAFIIGSVASYLSHKTNIGNPWIVGPVTTVGAVWYMNKYGHSLPGPNNSVIVQNKLAKHDDCPTKSGRGLSDLEYLDDGSNGLQKL